MKDNFTIREHNIKAHVQMELDIMKKKEGQITFTLRMNGGNIVDYSPVEYVDTRKKYGKLKGLIPEVRKKPNLSRGS